MTTVTGTPTAAPAYATAWPWLPFDAVMTPALTLGVAQPCRPVGRAADLEGAGHLEVFRLDEAAGDAVRERSCPEAHSGLLTGDRRSGA